MKPLGQHHMTMNPACPLAGGFDGRALVLGVACLLGLSACGQRTPAASRLPPPWIGELPRGGEALPAPGASATPHPIYSLMPTPPPAGSVVLEPTPDAGREPPVMRTSADTYVVQPGDTLGSIAGKYGLSATTILRANGLTNPDVLPVWMALTIPAPVPQAAGPAEKLLPDSELVFSPGAAFFDVEAEVVAQGGYLAGYAEEVEGQNLSGAEVVELVARRHSVNPRLLLSVLEYQSGWLRAANPSASTRDYPMGFAILRREGLYSQLALAADLLNTGYYLWRAGWGGPFVTPDSAAIPPGEGLNAGTVGVQYLFARLYASSDWRSVVSRDGFYALWTELYGNPFLRGIEPLLGAGLTQPELRLPFEDGVAWSFTGGPHGAWDSGAAWGALDFAPPGDALGCVLSDAWITASADGVVLRAGQGELILDLDGDGYEQTGWVLLYMHVEERGRVESGTFVHAGDRLGHPSCEGGYSNGTHVHIARKYNGEWIAADGPMPFVLDGWRSKGAGVEYDGTLERRGVILEACDCRNDGNQIAR